MQGDFISYISPACAGGKNKTLNLWSGNKEAIKIFFFYFSVCIFTKLFRYMMSLTGNQRY